MNYYKNFWYKKISKDVTIVYSKNKSKKNSNELNDKDFIIENNEALFASNEDTKKITQKKSIEF